MKQRTRIKICGIREPREALWAAQEGADAIGLVFYSSSPRYLEISQAREIVRQLPAFITVVGLFVDADAVTVSRIAKESGLDLLQFHGNESPQFCAGFDIPYMKAFRVHPGLDIPAAMARYPDAAAYLLDAWSSTAPGGTGATFDWKLIPESARTQSLVLAGGLHGGNVGEAIRTVKPYAVDVSSGVESKPGVKSRDRIREFVTAVNAAT